MLLAMVLPFWLLFLLQSYRVSVSVGCTLAYKHASLVAERTLMKWREYIQTDRGQSCTGDG